MRTLHLASLLVVPLALVSAFAGGNDCPPQIAGKTVVVRPKHAGIFAAGLMLSLALVACRSSSNDPRTQSDDASLRDDGSESPKDATTGTALGPAPDAAIEVPVDAAIDAPGDAGDAGDLDLLLPPWSDELTKCASEAVHLRLGFRGAFELDVTIGPGDGGRTEALIADDGRVYVARALTCFDRLALRIAADPRSKNRTFRVTVRGPYPRWILKHHG